ncbi:MAG: hypothetical protein IRZ14_18705 [Chloroflexi bacterium]|nr:hypothetical protein [Chloroflexota bacterium]
MPSGRPARGADEPVVTGTSAPSTWSDCALCQAPLPAGHRYLCAACVAASARTAAAILAGIAAPAALPPAEALPESLTNEPDDPDTCPTCGMRLDASGRCAGCVTTVRR